MIQVYRKDESAVDQVIQDILDRSDKRPKGDKK